jgi:hypothetical protein
MTIIHHLKVAVGADLRLFADCPNSGTTVYFNFISNAIRPDIVVDFKGSVHVVELTVPYETNCTKAINVARKKDTGI